MATTTMQTLVGLSSRCGIAGIPCQFSSRAVRTQRRNWGGGIAANIKAQAAAEEGEASSSSAAAAATEAGREVGGSGDGDDFEARLARLQRKVTSGTGKKAEARKARKEAGGDPYAATSAAKPKKDDMFIPPVPLKEPVSDGLPVELGMTPYTERLNGRLAALGLAAVLLVELATGDSFVKFHDTGTLTVQVYTVLGLAALFVKYEKEKISIWPK